MAGGGEPIASMGAAAIVRREDLLTSLERRSRPWDLVVIGGGATGLGCAVDAASRGLEVVLIEAADFGKGTSGRSSKLIHGGVRYLAAGWLGLVREGLNERRILLENAPHLVRPLRFVIPAESRLQRWWYRSGLGLYDVLAGASSIGASKNISEQELSRILPNIRRGAFSGGVEYGDALFDDTRFLIHLARTAHSLGAVVCNYVRAVDFLRDERQHICGVAALDLETQNRFEIQAKGVINASGAFADSLIALANPDAPKTLTLSQGTHVVIRKEFLRSDRAVISPRSSGGRVLFAIPWHGHVLAGPTHEEIREPREEPEAQEGEVQEILGGLAEILEDAPCEADVLSIWTGIRPLVKPAQGVSTSSRIPREHRLETSIPGLISVLGGKWTSYRKMSEECIDEAARRFALRCDGSKTKSLRLHGCGSDPAADASGDHLAVHGTDAVAIRALVEEQAALGERLDPELPYLAAEVVWAARHELARRTEDFLARRSRALVLNAAAAIRMAPRVTEILRAELGRSAEWSQAERTSFAGMAANYRFVSKS